MNETYKGFAGQVELRDDGIVIRRKGFWALMQHGFMGDKFIPFASIASVQFKKGGISRGYIQFGLLGAFEPKSGVFSAMKNENTVMLKNNRDKSFEKLADFVRQKISERYGTPPQRLVSSDPIIEGLERLTALHEKGLLTQQEFDNQKARLLG